jgi:ribosomal protein L37AE/L43A
MTEEKKRGRPKKQQEETQEEEFKTKSEITCPRCGSSSVKEEEIPYFQCKEGHKFELN